MLFFCVSNSFAGNVDTYGIGSKASALGGAFTAYADDPYAVYYNPAGLTQIRSTTLSTGVMAINPILKAKDFQVADLNIGPTNIYDKSPVLFAPHLGFAMPINEKIAAGISVYAPFGLMVEWEKNPAKNPGAYNCYKAGITREVATPALAYQVNDQWSFGLGVSMGKATDELKVQSYGLYALGVGVMGTPITAAEKIKMDDNFNYSFNVGTMYKPSQAVSIGLTYRSKTDVSYDGHLEFIGLDDSEKARLNTLLQIGSKSAMTSLSKYKFDVSMDNMDFPDQVQGGIRYQPYDRLSMEMDVVWTHWSMIDKETLKIDDPELRNTLAILSGFAGETTTGASLTNLRDWNDTRQLKFGIEWLMTDICRLRGGYFYDPTPIPDNTFDVVWADADKKTYSIGMGLDLNRWTVDTVLQYTMVEQERIIGGESVNLNNSFGGNSVALKADGAIWGFGATVSYAF